MITFIRHAEKDTDNFTSSITEDGKKRALEIDAPNSSIVICSKMPRSIETAKILYPGHQIYEIELMNEYDKSRETEEKFIERVKLGVEFLKAFKDCVVISHGKFMNVAYQVMTGKIAVGFDYLGSFHVE